MSNVRRTNAEEQLIPTRQSVVAAELVVDNVVVTALGMESTKISHVELCVKGNAVRYTLDGTDPVSSAAGAILGTGRYIWHVDKVRLARFIESVAGSDGVIRFEPLSE